MKRPVIFNQKLGVFVDADGVALNGLTILNALNATPPEARRKDVVAVPRALAERSAAMFQSVDPHGSLAHEWHVALTESPQPAKQPAEDPCRILCRECKGDGICMKRNPVYSDFTKRQ